MAGKPGVLEVVTESPGQPGPEAVVGRATVSRACRALEASGRIWLLLFGKWGAIAGFCAER